MTTLVDSFVNLKNIKVIDQNIDYEDYVALDLTISNSDLSSIDIKNPIAFETYIEKLLQENDAKVVFGGYNEKRFLYNHSGLFNDDSTCERNIHIGIDLWLKAGTPVLAAVDGKIHSFKNNIGTGDYGPTIILEHLLDGTTFYTLYGHLSIESISTIKIGDLVKQGNKIATLGNANVNGGYAPHLHFQIIKKIGDHKGDYPGVCSLVDLNYYLENCPDPNLLLKINEF
ncbi:peptidoglycan DD-metalloendopeptidase family protein [Flavobacterium sp.]|uniref:peptidoglycan DD-metalloendopeptidase family protein n=1 Tax=Flavobacterium sp. TaxID=239 RepID=UPI00286AEAC6|nr:peptidoglycan DD-metalloendopeptidase family protein [Flavobacterium sp.]